MDYTINLHGTTLTIPVRRKYTILCGDSATGKSSLARLAREKGTIGVSTNLSGVSGIHVPDSVLALLGLLDSVHPKRAIILLDEQVCAALTPNLCQKIHSCQSFFIFISRTPLPMIPTSDRCVFGLSYDGNKYIAVPQQLPARRSFLEPLNI